MCNFCQLHVHRMWSLLDGVGTDDQMVEAAMDQGQVALAQTEHGVLSGAMHHRRACLGRDEKGRKFREAIMPIFGVEAYFRPTRLIHDKTNWDYFHMTLWAKDAEGFRNLRLLTSEAYRTGLYRYPCIDLELAHKWRGGIIASTGCFNGWVPQAILKGEDSGEVESRFLQLQAIYGDDLIVEVMPLDFEDQFVINPALIEIADRHGHLVAATGDVHYPRKGWHTTQDVSLKMRMKQTFASVERRKRKGEDVFEFHTDELYLKSRDEMAASFAAHYPSIRPARVEEFLDNTMEVARRCTPFALDRTVKMPRAAATPADEDAQFWEWCKEGLARIGKTGDTVYVDQLNYEYTVFKDKDFVTFMLITADFVKWARRNGIEVGPGRGSAAGSLVSYLLEITDVDPIAYGMKFERFLNPHRSGMPDIDIDFDPRDVDRVKQYLADRWGHERVADLISHQTFGPKAAIRRVATVFDIPQAVVANATRAIEDDEAKDKIDIDLLAEVHPQLARYRDEHPDAWEHSRRLQGQVSAISEHPAGVILANQPIDNLVPIMKARAKDDNFVTAFGESADFHCMEYLGLLKLDFLVIKGLAKQRYACELIEKRTGERIDLSKLPIHADPYAVDPEVMKIFSGGYTAGIWQFGKSGKSKRLLRRIRPKNMLELAAVNALIRPGAQDGGLTDQYVERAQGASWTPWHPAVAHFMQATYGVLVFQEQVMDIVSALGGFNMAEADDVRRVISKDYRLGGEEARRRLQPHYERFLAGALARGVSKELTDEIWNYIGAFSDYSFNLPHAVVYACLSYRDAWLKCYYPTEFYAALLTYPASVAGADGKLSNQLSDMREARLLGVPTLPPDINTSDAGFTPVYGEGMRYGLQQIKGIGKAGVEKITIARKLTGPFTSVQDAAARAKLNAGEIKALGAAGAFDRFGARDHMTDEERAAAEEEKLGIALSGPDEMAPFLHALERICHTEAEIEAMDDGSPVVIGGELITGEERQTNRGKVYLRAQVGLGMDTHRIVVWPEEYKTFYEVLDNGGPLVMRGKWDQSWGQVVVNYIEPAQEAFAGETAALAGVA